MVFPWSLSNSKSPQVSRTLLGILANLNDVDLMMFNCSLISNLPFLLPILWGLFQVHQLQLPLPSPSCSTVVVFSSLQSSDIYLFFRLLLILRCGLPGQQSSLFSWFSNSFFLFLLLTITRTGRLAEIRWSVCIIIIIIIIIITIVIKTIQKIKAACFPMRIDSTEIRISFWNVYIWQERGKYVTFFSLHILYQLLRECSG